MHYLKTTLVTTSLALAAAAMPLVSFAQDASPMSTTAPADTMTTTEQSTTIQDTTQPAASMAPDTGTNDMSGTTGDTGTGGTSDTNTSGGSTTQQRSTTGTTESTTTSNGIDWRWLLPLLAVPLILALMLSGRDRDESTQRTVNMVGTKGGRARRTQAQTDETLDEYGHDID